MAIRNKGTKFQVDVSVKGVRAPRVSCDTLAEAQAVEAKFKAHLLGGGDPVDLVPGAAAPSASKGPTLGELLDATYRDRWRGTKAEASSLRNGTVWADELGYDFPVHELGPERVTEVCDRLAVKGNSNGTINRKLAALSVMLGVGESRGWCQKFKLPKKKEYEGRLRYYTDDEVESLLEHVEGDADMRALFFLAVETGMRQSELLGLTRRDVDAERGLLLLGETKGNKRRSVPMTDAVKPVVTRLMRDKKAHERLFPERITSRSISRVISLWKGKRGLPADDEACFHTFRHTTCSRLVQRGVPIAVIQKWMGHNVIETTMRYAHLAPDSLDIALAALNERKSA